MQNIMAPNNFTWPLINDNITQGDRKVLADFCLHGERFTNGPKVKEFEKIYPKSKCFIVDGEVFSWYGPRILKLENELLRIRKINN